MVFFYQNNIIIGLSKSKYDFRVNFNFEKIKRTKLKTVTMIIKHYV